VDYHHVLQSVTRDFQPKKCSGGLSNYIKFEFCGTHITIQLKINSKLIFNVIKMYFQHNSGEVLSIFTERYD